MKKDFSKTSKRKTSKPCPDKQKTERISDTDDSAEPEPPPPLIVLLQEEDQRKYCTDRTDELSEDDFQAYETQQLMHATSENTDIEPAIKDMQQMMYETQIRSLLSYLSQDIEPEKKETFYMIDVIDAQLEAILDL